MKVRQAVVMSPVQDRAVISEKSGVNDILEFFGSYVLEETD